jgi:hypothetical protein
MNNIMLAAFIDEVEKIKEAGGLIKNLGDGAMGLGKAVVRNARNTLKGFSTPVDSIREGLASNKSLFAKTMLGTNAIMTAPQAFSSQDPSGMGKSRVERASSWLGDQAGGLIGAKHGILTGPIVGATVGRTIGKTTGKTLDAVRGYRANITADSQSPAGISNEAY